MENNYSFAGLGNFVCGERRGIQKVVNIGEQRQSRGHKTHCFPEVSVNKCFVI
jgi:hypothetical protein